MSRNSVKVTRRTPESNIPILVTQAYHAGDDNDMIYTFGGKTYGIFAPFEGIFLLRVHEAIPQGQSERPAVIKIDNIYGAAQTLYRWNTAVTIGSLDAGMYICHFNTDERKLYLV